MTHPITRLAARRRLSRKGGLVSVCSAHPRVIAVALRAARDAGEPALIEATCNQVNQDGGYTGMTPDGFRDMVLAMAAPLGLSLADGSLILGGDHLGPNPWRHLPADRAMAKARAMIAAYAAAGFTKLHLDCSMGCAGEPAALDDATVAARATDLAAAAEAAVPKGGSTGAQAPVYIVGTEVPVPGGATGPHAVQVTAPAAARRTWDLHRAAFAAAGLDALFDSRVHGLVVQPGVEFDNVAVLRYDPPAAAGLSAALRDLPGLMFEAHSTDYQSAGALAALVADGFAILKVGPALTFALREALYGLDRIAADMGRPASLRAAMEEVMQAAPGNWAPYCHGSERAQEIARHTGLSDRIRYYWPDARAQAAVAALFSWLGPAPLRDDLLRAHLPQLWEEIAAGRIPPHAEALADAMIARELAPYFRAVGA